MEILNHVPISVHCWQDDDLHALYGKGNLSDGIAVTGSYPGCPRNEEELHKDILEAMRLIPSKSKLNLHSSYAQLRGRNVDHDAYKIDDYCEWVDFVKENRFGLDFN